MPPNEKQFSIGKLIYLTALAATIVASLMTGYPYGFIYTIGFVLITGSYIVWRVTRPIPDDPKSIVDEWEMDRLAEEKQDDQESKEPKSD